MSSRPQAEDPGPACPVRGPGPLRARALRRPGPDRPRFEEDQDGVPALERGPSRRARPREPGPLAQRARGPPAGPGRDRIRRAPRVIAYNRRARCYLAASGILVLV